MRRGLYPVGFRKLAQLEPFESLFRMLEEARCSRLSCKPTITRLCLGTKIAFNSQCNGIWKMTYPALRISIIQELQGFCSIFVASLGDQPNRRLRRPPVDNQNWQDYVDDIHPSDNAPFNESSLGIDDYHPWAEKIKLIWVLLRLAKTTHQMTQALPHKKWEIHEYLV